VELPGADHLIIPWNIQDLIDMTNEILRKFTGPTLRELVEKGDFETSRKIVMVSWMGMLCMGFVIGVSLSRAGWI
jgi:hypothetical protein